MFGIVGDDLTVVLFFIGLAATFAVAGMSQAGWKHRVFIGFLFLVAAFFLVAGISWPWLKDLSPELRDLAMLAARSPISWFSLIVLGLSAVLFINNSSRTTAVPALELVKNVALHSEESVFVADINIAAGLTPQTPHPALLIGKAALNEKRLRIVVTHSYYAEGMGWSGWVSPRQVELADIKDVISGQSITIPIVSCKSPIDNNSMRLMWGQIDGPPVNEIRKGYKYRAQIRIIGANGAEQRPIYFLLIRTTVDEAPYIVDVTRDTEFYFTTQWSNKVA